MQKELLTSAISDLLHVFLFSFLLDRLLQYEKVDASATDTDVTASTDSDEEQHAPPVKRCGHLNK